MPARRCFPNRSAPVLAAVLLALLSGCSSTADFGRLNPVLVTDDIHAWVGQEAAASAGAAISAYPLTDDERTLRDLAFPLIEPPYDRLRWDAVVLEYGTKESFQRKLWVSDNTAYYRHLQAVMHRSSTARYNLLIDDIRNDIVRIEPFFATARRVLDLDRRREASLQRTVDLNPSELANAKARIGENSMTIAWVYHSLKERCAGYRFALDRLAVGEPEPAAAQADQVLAQLQQEVAANEVVPAPRPAVAVPAPPPAK